MEPMMPNFLQIKKDGRKIFFRVHIEKRLAFSEYQAYRYSEKANFFGVKL